MVDAESAYRFCPVQVADLWSQCFIWFDEHGVTGVCVDERLTFGGAFAPNRFERISTLVAAYAQTLHDSFDAAQPPPTAVARWSAERAARQRLGLIPSGAGQLLPRWLQVYIDDFSGVALDDAVVTPPEVAHIVIDPQRTASEGGVPAVPSTRVYVHAQLTVMALLEVGLSASPGKVVAGDPVVALGFLISRASHRITCPSLKRESMLEDMREQLGMAESSLSVDRVRAERLTGRLCNLSQIFPELKAYIHGGYRVSQATWAVGGRRRKPPRLALKAGSEAYDDWVDCLDIAIQLIDENVGVDIAPELVFPATTHPGTALVTTDASGVDGYGGYVFFGDDPFTVWLVSEEWEPGIIAAFERASATGGAVPGGGPSFSMPAGELFGAVATLAAAEEARGRRAEQAIFIGDCDPAVFALNSGASPVAQIREVLGVVRGRQALAISVPREANVDADRLSHPSQYEEVRASAQAAQLTARRARVGESLLAVARRAADIGVRPSQRTRGPAPQAHRPSAA